MPGVLVLAATPIGDSRDASPRLLDELSSAPIIAAEDTRRLRKLCDRLGVTTTGRVVSYHEHNEASRTPDLIASMTDGERVLLVTDAGMPSVSDPGYRLVSEAVRHGIKVTCVPGPSAVLMALAVSGLPVERFCFEGFLPRKSGQRERMIADLADEKRTMVFFEAPHRLATMLTALADGLGHDRPAAVCRELTKTYEEVKRGGLGELTQWAADGVRGEITIVVAGASAIPAQDPNFDQLVIAIEARVAAGERLKDVCREVGLTSSESSRSLYDAVLAARLRT
ncbi:MAG: 16S rRNA (cytidine(1402)-2'-O)-methyltransferase [Ornithinimicrobium sp.]